MTEPRANKTIMRSLGEFFGHIVKAVRSDPDSRTKLVKKTTQEHVREDGIILRRTTIEEVEIKQDQQRQAPDRE